MDLKDIEALKQSVREWKTIGHSATFPMPIKTAEQLIAAAISCKREARSFPDAINGVRG